MKKENKFNITLNKEIYESDFYHNLLKDELEEIIAKEKLGENQLHIFSAYIYENDDEIEVGVYIVNSSENEIKVNNLPLAIYRNEQKISSEELSVNKKIEGYSSVFKEFKINKENIKEEYELQEISIGIDDLRKLKKYPYIKIDINNIPKIKEYINYRDIKKFLNNLSIMEKNQLAIDVFRTGEGNDDFYIIALFRNSSNREINIKSIPLEVYNDIDLLIYKDTFVLNDDSLKIEGNSGKMMVINIPSSDFPIIEGEDLTKYKVEIK